MLFVLSVFLGVAVVSFLTLRLGGINEQPLRDGLSASQTLLAISILIIGLAWYFFERPDAQRVDASLATQTVQLSDSFVLVRAELRMKNAGISRVNLEGEQATFRIRKIKRFETMTPARAALLPEGTPQSHDITSLLQSPELVRPDDGDPFELWDYTSKSFPVMIVDQVPLLHDLETGETETQDYHRIFDCNDYEIFLIEASVPKRKLFWESGSSDRAWVETAMVVLTDVCSREN